MTMTLEGVRGQPHAGLLFTPGNVPLSIVQKAGWAPGPVWTGVENLAPTGFDPRTVQSVASRYTDYAIRPTSLCYRTINECGMRCAWLLPGGNRKPRKLLRITSVGTDIWILVILYTKLYLHLTTTFCRSASNNVLRLAPYGTACIVTPQYCDTLVLWNSSIVTLQYCDTPVFILRPAETEQFFIDASCGILLYNGYRVFPGGK